MRDKDQSIGNAPAKSDSEGNGVAGEGFLLWVVNEVSKRVVNEGDLDCSDGGGNIFGVEQGDFDSHFVAGVAWGGGDWGGNVNLTHISLIGCETRSIGGNDTK